MLKPAGSLYLFSGHRLASDIEIMMRERFNVMNHIIGVELEKERFNQTVSEVRQLAGE